MLLNLLIKLIIIHNDIIFTNNEIEIPDIELD